LLAGLGWGRPLVRVFRHVIGSVRGHRAGLKGNGALADATPADVSSRPKCCPGRQATSRGEGGR
jgi:hypothetical protein